MAKWSYIDDQNVEWFKSLCSKSEIDIEEINGTYHLRATYLEKFIFDFYPKSLKLRPCFENDKFYQLNSHRWKNQIQEIITLVQLEEGFKEVLSNKNYSSVDCRTQIIKWENPKIDKNEHNLKCEIALFETWDNEILLGRYDNDCFVTPNGDSYDIYNDVKVYAIIK